MARLKALILSGRKKITFASTADNVWKARRKEGRKEGERGRRGVEGRRELKAEHMGERRKKYGGMLRKRR